MQLELTEAQREVLEDLLQRAMGGLREEIYKSEVAEYKQALKEREVIIQNLLDQVRTTSPAT
jgi:hypothetical protein